MFVGKGELLVIPVYLTSDLLQYKDIDGNPCTIYVLARRDPRWAASRIQALEVSVAILHEDICWDHFNDDARAQRVIDEDRACDVCRLVIQRCPTGEMK